MTPWRNLDVGPVAPQDLAPKNSLSIATNPLHHEFDSLDASHNLRRLASRTHSTTGKHRRDASPNRPPTETRSPRRRPRHGRSHPAPRGRTHRATRHKPTPLRPFTSPSKPLRNTDRGHSHDRRNRTPALCPRTRHPHRLPSRNT
jgi:hypothetical protein